MIDAQITANSDFAIGQIIGGGILIDSTSFINGGLLSEALSITSINTQTGLLVANGVLINSLSDTQTGLLVANGIVTASPLLTSGSIIINGYITPNSNYQNSLLAIQACFGINVSQNADFLIIQKADLPDLIPNFNNRGEQLFAAIFLQMLKNYELSSMTDRFHIFHWKSYFENGYVKHLLVVQELQTIGDKT
ncbi:hypothetical protein BZZ01_32750 (plasmid) [Nostocales cyanobacterium HT-58-2]|nr:hypothetical protein BZZ01_32750 [Nostocales cyanobacterium HT-58-2]